MVMYFLRETLGCGNLGVTVIDAEEVTMEPGDAVRVDPASSRRLHADAASTLVVAGAP
jgi:hypothetical protein